MNFKRICVGSKVGALTGFVSDANGAYFGLSAFHVLSGSNRIIDPFDDKVEIYNTEANSWLQSGITVEGRYSKGDGTNNNFGILDYAYFEMFSSFINRIKFDLTELALSQYLADLTKQSLVNMLVFGYSVIDEREIKGRIKNIFYQGQSNRFDVEINIVDGYTHEGDSGMLWRDEHNQPLLMHISGNLANYSTKSYCTFLDRIVGNKPFFCYDQRLTV